MSYYFSKSLDKSFEDAILQTTDSLQKEGFGVLSEIRIDLKLKEKLGVEFPRYIILGACNPALAYKALTVENKIGTMLPCNIIVQESGPQRVEVTAVDPVASMKAIENPALIKIASEVAEKLRNVIAGL